MSNPESKFGCILLSIPFVGLILLVGQCRSCSNKKEKAHFQKAIAEKLVEKNIQTEAFNAEIQSYLNEYAPSLAVKRRETLRAIEEAQTTRTKLSMQIDKFPTEAAKSIFREKVGQYDLMIRKLNKLLATINHETTIALARKEAREIEGVGIGEMDSEALLIKDAESILSEAALLNSDSDPTRGDKPNPADSDASAPRLKQNAGVLDQGGLASSEAPENPPSPMPTPPESAADKLLRKTNQLSQKVKDAMATLANSTQDESAESPPAPGPAPQSGQPPVRTPAPEPLPAKPAKPFIDPAAIEREIRSLNASIATHQANLDKASARIREITKNHTRPVVSGSRQHQEIQAIQSAIETSNEALPRLSNLRDKLEAELERK